MHDTILAAREQRAKTIELWLHQGHELVLSIRANMPTELRESHEAYVVVRFFESLIKKTYTYTRIMRFDSSDGPYTLLSFHNLDARTLKADLIHLEESISLGRLVDLDLWQSPDHLWSRTSLGHAPRKCYLCDDAAHNCVRSKKHDVKEIIAFIKEIIYKHLNDEMKHIAEHAIIKELNLDHKFGLVTPTSMGSHHDMDYQLMLDSHSLILPYFVKLFTLGYTHDELYQLLDLARPIGIKTEKEMLDYTHGVNTYKGLIFILGLVTLSLGYTLKHKQDFNHIFQNIHYLSQNILSDFEKKPKTFGEKAYHEHQILGARGEAYLGLPSVHHALNLIGDKPLTDELLREVLQQLIRSTDDTVLLKRSGSFEKYMMIKKRVASIDVRNLDEVKTFTVYAIENHLSFGGAADLLIATIFLYEIKHTYF